MRRAVVVVVVVALAAAALAGTPGKEAAVRRSPQPQVDRPEFWHGVHRSLAESQSDIARMFQYVLNGTGKGMAYDYLANMTDTFGPRLSGSASHQAAVNWLIAELQSWGLDNVHGEDVMVPHWERGFESLTMLQPRVKDMAILGLGTSIGTNGQPLTAEAIVVDSFDALKGVNATGKIVVFNQYCDWVANPVGCYGISVAYRTGGAAAASAAGAVACIVRSVTSLSLYTPHTGEQSYVDGIAPIPVACATVEDVELMSRMQARGDTIVLTLVMEATNYPEWPSQNVVAEITGSVWPDEVVLVSGHMDSWDVGQGAMDDGGGAAISWTALKVMKDLGIQPKRTIRFVGWACEEFGGIGSYQYWERHRVNASLHSLVMESDIGTFQAWGIGVTASPAATQILESIAALLAPINATLVEPGGEDTDTAWWAVDNVPAGSLGNDNDLYFHYHHSNADTMTVQDPDEMDSCVLTFAVHALSVANLDTILPRTNTTFVPPAGGRRHPKH